MRSLLVLATVAAGLAAASPAQAAKPACTGSAVFVLHDQPTACDLTPPQALHVIAASTAECADAGGQSFGICWNVDY